MKVTCSIEYTTAENENGNDVEAVSATCERCGHEVESFGNSGQSIRRCLALMREECPKSEKNWYESDVDDR